MPPPITSPKFASPSASEASLDDLSLVTSYYLVNQYCDSALAKSSPSSAEFFIRGFATRSGDVFVMESGSFGLGKLMVMRMDSRAVIVRGESVGGVGMDFVWFWCQEVEEFLEEGEIPQKWMVVVPDGLWQAKDVSIWDVRFKRIFRFGRKWMSRFQRPIELNSSCEDLVVKEGACDCWNCEGMDGESGESSSGDSASEKGSDEVLIDF